jgi:16S rRNA processing protein RimM
MSAAGRESAGHRLRAGIVGRAHGLDGSFHVAEVTAEVFAAVELGSEVEVAGSARQVARLAGHAARPILRLEGAATRDDAELLRGEGIWVSREVAPELEEDEWWAQDLEGCAVHDGARAVGTVARLLALPSCEVLEVRWDSEPDRQPLLVPLVRDAVRGVDLEARAIDVDLAFLGEA